MSFLKEIINSYFDLFKVKAIKRGVNVLTEITVVLITVILVMISLFFLAIGLALYVGYLLDSYFLGFLIVGASSFILLIIFNLFKTKFKNKLHDLFTKVLTKTAESDESDE